MLRLVRRGFFVICLFFFTVVCWRLLTASHNKQLSVPYAAFLQALDGGKIQKTSIYMGYTLADLKFVAKDSSEAEVTDVSTKDLPSLIKRMIDDGVSVEFASGRKANTSELLLNLTPILFLLVAVGYFYFVGFRKKA
jgi:ATP-dependent Zn protease